ncbi:MAG: hypothetical protein ACHQAY_12845 [Hyphomicrobiales bacterium]
MRKTPLRRKAPPKEVATEDLATIEDYAAGNFEPFDIRDSIPSNERWAEMGNPHLIVLRLAALVCSKSKPQLVAMARKPNAPSMNQDFIERFEESKKLFTVFADLLDRAWTRTMSAVSVVALEKEAAKRASRKRKPA